MNKNPEVSFVIRTKNEDYDWAKEMLFRGYNIVKYKPFSIYHSHLMLGRPGYFEMLPKWREWAAIVDKKKRG